MLKLTEKHTTLDVIDDQIGGPTPAKYIAKACVEIARELIYFPQKTGIYHLTGSPDVSWYEFANAIFEKVGKEVTK